MRPELLNPAFTPVGRLKGCGPKIAALIEKLAGGRLVDLWWHRPSGLIDRRYRPTVAEAEPGRICTLQVEVRQHQPPRVPRLPYRILVGDATGSLTLVFFNGRADYLNTALPVGETRVISGLLELFDGRAQMTHPDRIGTPEEIERLAKVEPVYPLTAGLAPRLLAKLVEDAISRAPHLPEWLDPAYQARNGWPDWHDALMRLHHPQSAADLEATAPHRMRLAYDELLANQLALLLVRRRLRRRRGRALVGDGRFRDALARRLPWPLTNAQVMAIAEIAGDMASENRMLRLLQGDVGSGKTMVALHAMLVAVEAGAQAAMMAPTEILARQHFESLRPHAEALGLRMVLLTGRDKGKARAALLQDLANGAIHMVVGTHALFQDDVAFQNLGLAVVDEQHRFGVGQRLLLSAKGEAVDMLVMTATPIPRTLSLTAYGDMDVSKLTEKPPGRQPVDTRVVSAERLDEVMQAVARRMAAGEQIYWVCPLVEESEAVDLQAASERHAALRVAFGAAAGDRIGLVHGQMPAAEKDAAMEAFVRGDTRILVATTVIEVGVDVPEATLMVIEHAERFGLAQLHQLRGRVGRGGRAGACLLIYYGKPGETARARLKIMRETDDGFRIAEEDLRLRGAGEVLGTRQSGLPDFRLADLLTHGELLATARDDARLILERDPDLRDARGAALRHLLYLFERDAAIQFLRSG